MVVEDVRRVRRPRTVALALSLVVLFVVVGPIVGGGGGFDSLLDARAEGGEPRAAPAPQSPGIGVGDLFGGLVGAILVALVTVGYTENRGKHVSAQRPARAT